MRRKCLLARAARPNVRWDTLCIAKAEVDALIDQARRAGAVVTDPPHDAFWGGYTGSFQDPDGHLWEIAWNPEMDPGD